MAARKDPRATAAEVVAEKYPEARVAFLAGSVTRGEGTQTSDLDLVVIYNKLPQAYRESFVSGGWPIEAFVHDLPLCEEVLRPSGGWLFDGHVLHAPESWRASDAS